MQYTFSGVWLISFSAMVSEFIHVVTCQYFILFMAEQHPTVCVYTTFCLSGLLLMDIRGVFTLAILSNAAVNVGIQVSVEIPLVSSFGYMSTQEWNCWVMW